MKFYIYIENRLIAEVTGIDYAYEVYDATVKLAELLCETANLVDGETGEVLACSADFDDEPAGIDDDCGFDAYEGCYTFDC